ncbi:multidrug ABC transporter ATP-binding protein [Rhodothalassium salexigens]|uniref:ABC transporter ATP-binding protein n=1 Tax=Rhodothalassium salexigens TaxID=1086 RepID=UPI001912960D|nr:ATP-binding cassette domain-containing protein [Rhodothalassium salexigens]MBK5912636.1 multidrug ABC transporter ATP-binding protein [Rhodothalassium salexigens]MBK5919584.1 multidrug ABC transporter ATP-binding protein [Rhodothalassium salexigens]
MTRQATASSEPVAPAEAAAADTSRPIIRARGLAKQYGDFTALDHVDFDVAPGRILGVIGANGAGKTTLLNAILGLIPHEGELTVFGRDPARERALLMRDVCFIADVATLPKWMTAAQVFDYVEGVHPGFDRTVALDFLSRTSVPLSKKIKKLSKGMTTQLHLSIVMAIDARLLVLDEPTLGLDILFRKQFYRSLLEEYFDDSRTIIVTTHQVEEIEHILTDVMFIRDGRIVLEAETEALESRFAQVSVDAGHADALRGLGPLYESGSLGRKTFAFDGADRAELQRFATPQRMSLADIFVATMQGAPTGDSQ